MGALIGFAIAGGIIILIITASAFIPRVDCSGTSLYYEGKVEFIFDGDTIQVEGCKIRLPLVDTPEKVNQDMKKQQILLLVFVQKVLPF